MNGSAGQQECRLFIQACSITTKPMQYEFYVQKSVTDDRYDTCFHKSLRAQAGKYVLYNTKKTYNIILTKTCVTSVTCHTITTQV